MFSVDKKNQLDVTFVFFIFLLLVAQHVSWQPSCSHGTYQHEAITSRSRQLLMMGTWLPETCWATNRRKIKNTKVTSSWFFLSTLNYNARSTTHQINVPCVNRKFPIYFSLKIFLLVLVLYTLKVAKFYTLGPHLCWTSQFSGCWNITLNLHLV